MLHRVPKMTQGLGGPILLDWGTTVGSLGLSRATSSHFDFFALILVPQSDNICSCLEGLRGYT
jgi:hypothetical protein